MAKNETERSNGDKELDYGKLMRRKVSKRKGLHSTRKAKKKTMKRKKA